LVGAILFITSMYHTIRLGYVGCFRYTIFIFEIESKGPGTRKQTHSLFAHKISFLGSPNTYDPPSNWDKRDARVPFINERKGTCQVHVRTPD